MAGLIVIFLCFWSFLGFMMAICAHDNLEYDKVTIPQKICLGICFGPFMWLLYSLYISLVTVCVIGGFAFKCFGMFDIKVTNTKEKHE